MISFRYHLVSIVAVFLALGLGILAGTTAINQTLVDRLKSETNELKHDKGVTDNRLSRLQAFADLLVPHVLEGRLTGQEVVVVHDENADGDAVTTALDFLVDAGANVLVDFPLASKMGAEDAGTQETLRDALGVSQIGESVSADAARVLADRLAVGWTNREPGPPGSESRPDVLEKLLDQGFLVPEGIDDSDLPKIGGPGQMVVVVGGGKSDPAVPFESFLVPFVERLLQDSVHVAVTEPTRAPKSLVEEVRSDPDIADFDGMLTVDDLDASTFYGGVGLVLGLDRLSRTGTGGDYGVKDGASDLIPPTQL